MCFPWTFFKKKPIYRNFDQIFPCSCDICGQTFTSLDQLIIHMGNHDTEDINRKLLHGYGTVDVTSVTDLSKMSRTCTTIYVSKTLLFRVFHR